MLAIEKFWPAKLCNWFHFSLWTVQRSQGFQASKKSRGLSLEVADALLDRKSGISLGHLTKIQLTQWEGHSRPKRLDWHWEQTIVFVKRACWVCCCCFCCCCMFSWGKDVCGGGRLRGTDSSSEADVSHSEPDSSSEPVSHSSIVVDDVSQRFLSKARSLYIPKVVAPDRRISFAKSSISFKIKRPCLPLASENFTIFLWEALIPTRRSRCLFCKVADFFSTIYVLSATTIREG